MSVYSSLEGLQATELNRNHLLVRLAQQALQTQQHSTNVVDSAPLVLEDVQTDTAREVDIGVVDGCLEEHRWRAVRVV